MPRFQAIQAANEVLSDATTKAKYDQDRRTTGLYPAFKTAGPTPGNPYAATSAYPPPPRRTQPGTWQRPAPAAGQPTGADRFTNFPRPANAMPRGKDSADRTQQFRAWQNMNSGPTPEKPRYPNPGPPPPPRSPNPQTQQQNAARPRMNRADTKIPPEEKIRAGFRYGGSAAPAAEQQTAWHAFQTANAGKPGMNSKRPQGRAPTTPRRPGGFDPNAPGSDERPAPPSTGHYVHRHKSEDFTADGFPPPPPGPPPTSAPHSPTPPQNLRPFPPRQPSSRGRTPNDEVPYAEGNRVSTPYASFIGEKLQFGDGLRRSASTRDTTRLQPESNSPSSSRARSSSPPLRQTKTADGTTNGRKQGFAPGVSSESSDGSEESSEFNPDQTESPEEKSDSSATNGRSQHTPRAPEDRPKKVPRAPSSRLNGSNLSADGPSLDSGHQSDSGRPPSMEQRPSSNNMYANPSPSANTPSARTASTPFSRTKWISDAFGSLSFGVSNAAKSAIPKWAVPSSVSPSASSSTLKRKDSGIETAASSSPTLASAQDFEHANKDPLWYQASSATRQAYLNFRTQLRALCDKDEDLNLLNVEVFLRLTATVRDGKSVGDMSCDRLLKDAIYRFPSVGLEPVSRSITDKQSSANSFHFPVNGDTFNPTKSRSFDNINTKFSPDGFSGTFMGSPGTAQQPDYFTAAGRRPSPGRRGQARRADRANTHDGGPASNGSTPGSMGPPPRPDETQAQPTTFTSPTDVKFDEQQWKSTFRDPSWTWKPEVRNESQNGSRSKTPSRKGSRLHTNSQTATTGTQEQPHIMVDEPDTASHVDPAATTTGDADAMDIDTEPPVSSIPPNAEQETATQPTSTKGPRYVSVEPSTWRKQQEAEQRSPSAARHSRNATEPQLKTNLDDLSHVEPIAKSADGLKNLADLSSTLPFQSSAAASTSTQSLRPQKLVTPNVPKAPQAPTKLTKQSWHVYALAFGTYLEHFHGFNKTMLAHFDTRQKQADTRMVNGTAWLEATGDPTSQMGWGHYLKGVLEDEAVRTVWDLGCERHLEAVKKFQDLRERVRKLVSQGALVDA